MNNTEIFKYLPNYHDPVVDIEKALRNNSWLGDAAATIAMMDNDTIPVDERILYGRFYIDSLLHEMAGFYAYRTNSQYLTELQELIRLPPAFEMNSTDGRFSASKNHIIVFPDTTRKLIDAMKDIEQEGFNLAEEIPKGKYYPELNLVVVTNHRHHVAAAQATNSIFEIDFNGSIVPLPATSPLYSTIDFHFSDEEGNIVCRTRVSFLLACLHSSATIWKSIQILSATSKTISSAKFQYQNVLLFNSEVEYGNILPYCFNFHKRRIHRIYSGLQPHCKRRKAIRRHRCREKSCLFVGSL